LQISLWVHLLCHFGAVSGVPQLTILLAEGREPEGFLPPALLASAKPGTEYFLKKLPGLLDVILRHVVVVIRVENGVDIGYERVDGLHWTYSPVYKSSMISASTSRSIIPSPANRS